jgi:hypothetical protein
VCAFFLCAGLVLSGCAGPGTAAPTSVAMRFHAAVSQQNGALACALLAPETRSELVQAAGEPCSRAVLGEAIPDVGRVRESDRFGVQAQVQMSGDTVFLAEFPGGWRVVAAACTPRRALPYDCQVKGV